MNYGVVNKGREGLEDDPFKASPMRTGNGGAGGGGGDGGSEVEDEVGGPWVRVGVVAREVVIEAEIAVAVLLLEPTTIKMEECYEDANSHNIKTICVCERKQWICV
ncbi:hypothetical protein LOK49_LG07G02339 [Camellia lanceoleosa]|uniref:Uncharacterized protein n=2 Tax=Camellia lanceoleosa TaxID=1840588 RepID=A0ACC0H174_9ERIC|nr:hypothetical protein LOK49_LG14G00305 [Camellia lanceoleosa]KAI8006345.1 hypothetical protein LOK49_LG07G02339 [Camellia lanceoleosa]